MTKNVYICLLLVICSLTACSPSLREAQDVVAQADSLWHAGQMYGVDAGDSATLAHAYETLNVIPFPFREGLGLGSSYAHACYHYGKLLRAKDNPEEAMQAFINATHSRTRDYHILGRVYSNIGSICHMAEEYSHSYDMYELSAGMFLKNGDTTAYYYALNDMAFELVMLADTPSVFSLLAKISDGCADNAVLTKTLETKAELYLRIQQYDSALLYTSRLCAQSEYFPIADLIRAQIYSYQGMKDSAVYYAEQVIRYSSDMFDIHNALYILTNDDERKDKEAIRATAADRSDLQKVLRVRQGKLSQAVQLLEEDINRKPDFKWLYAIIATIAFIGTGITIYTYRKRRQHQLLSQKVNEMQSKSDAIKLQHEQMVHEHADYKNKLLEHLEYNSSVFSQSDNFPNNLNWKDFDAMCIVIDNNYNMLATKLRHKYILSEKEIRLCILVLMNISRPRMAEILPYAASGIGKFKDQTAKKIGTSGKKMHAYLLEMAVGD